MSDTNYKKTMLTLPGEVATNFSLLKGDTEKRNAYIAALRAAEWTLQSISQAAGITRERVRQLAEREYPGVDISAYGVPTPPEHVRPAPREYIEPDPVKLARMLELQDVAQKVRSNSLNYRSEAQEYTALIADSHLNDGVTLYRLAKRLGVSHAALRFRLARYGYKQPAKGGTSKVYTPIKPENLHP